MVVRAVVAGLLLATAACSSPGPAYRATPPSSSDVQQYLNAVNALCDALLPKMQAATGGGHPDVYPVAEYEAEEPQQAALVDQFDLDLAAVHVPADAATEKEAMDKYLAFKEEVDRRRAAAAAEGQDAFDLEIRAENAELPTDPTVAARTEAGFHISCDAR